MEVRLQTIDSFSGEYTEEVREVDSFTGSAIRDAYNRELIELNVPVAGLFTLVDWRMTKDETKAAFTLRSFCPSNHYMVGIAYLKPPKNQK
ncbi:hypothetical protein D3C81_1618670 [compost metagenome]